MARRVERVQIERAADEILALKEGSLEAHAINQSAATVYELCDGNTSKSEMAAEIHRRTGLPADEEIVDLALSELVETGLVTLDDSEPRLRCDSARADSAIVAVVGISLDAATCRNRRGTAGGGATTPDTNADTYTNSSCNRQVMRRRF